VEFLANQDLGEFKSDDTCKFLKEIFIKVPYGDVQLGGELTKDVSIDSEAGHVTSNARGKVRLQIHTKIGNVTVKGDNILYIDTMSGSINVTSPSEGS